MLLRRAGGRPAARTPTLRPVPVPDATGPPVTNHNRGGNRGGDRADDARGLSTRRSAGAAHNWSTESGRPPAWVETPPAWTTPVSSVLGSSMSAKTRRRSASPSVETRTRRPRAPEAVLRRERTEPLAAPLESRADGVPDAPAVREDDVAAGAATTAGGPRSGVRPGRREAEQEANSDWRSSTGGPNEPTSRSPPPASRASQSSRRRAGSRGGLRFGEPPPPSSNPRLCPSVRAREPSMKHIIPPGPDTTHVRERPPQVGPWRAGRGSRRTGRSRPGRGAGTGFSLESAVR